MVSRLCDHSKLLSKHLKVFSSKWQPAFIKIKLRQSIFAISTNVGILLVFFCMEKPKSTIFATLCYNLGKNLSYIENLSQRNTKLQMNYIIIYYRLYQTLLKFHIIFQIFSILTAENFQLARNNYHCTSIFPRFLIFFRIPVIKKNKQKFPRVDFSKPVIYISTDTAIKEAGVNDVKFDKNYCQMHVIFINDRNNYDTSDDFVMSQLLETNDKFSKRYLIQFLTNLLVSQYHYSVILVLRYWSNWKIKWFV